MFTVREGMPASTEGKHHCLQMISTRAFRAHPLWLCASTATPRPRRTCMRAAAPESADKIDTDASQQLEAVEKPVGHPFINPVTGNPQTGKLIDLYFEVFSILVVVALSFWSLYNVKDVIDQTDSADALRQPAAKTEWLALDNKDVRPPPSPPPRPLLLDSIFSKYQVHCCSGACGFL